MRIGSTFVEAVLVAANLAAVLVLGAVYVTRDSGPATASDTSAPTLDSPPVLVVVSRDSATDVAVGQSLADALGGALLAVTAAGLTDDMTSELSWSRPDEVLVLGGPAAVTPGTVSALRQYTSGSVTRLSGADRFTTAATVAATQFPSSVAKVRIMSGDETRAPAPARAQPGNGPVLLVERTRIPADTAAALHQLHPRSIDVLGGPADVSDGLLRQLQAFTPGRVVRLP